MREMIKHTPGKLFLAILALSVLVIVLVLPFVVGGTTVFFGWMSFPLFSGILLMLIWIVAFVVYLGKFWPYR